ncbi:MAG: UvrD-helicase domain-containing protein, partial [Alphaproteobacteria bacterium]|nr:UvrD-helicase domain-containing protein [Alphaproteobacteria bacterium]
DYQNRFRHILVDEYQDTNMTLYLWLRLLAQARSNICCVGDDDQSIYGWRGAEVGNILRFENDFAGAQIIRLERNYRSTCHILGAASGLIAHNKNRLGKTLWTQSKEGEKVKVRGAWDGEQEAVMTASDIESYHAKGHKLNEIAVLVRAGFQMREFEDRFITLDLPYRVIGGPRFYERAEIRDANAYLRLINQADDDLAFERICNKPRRGFGDMAMQTLHKLARKENISLSKAALLLVESEELRPATRRSLESFNADLARWRTHKDKMAHDEFAGLVLEESGYMAMWQAAKTLDAPGRLDNLKELVSSMAEFASLDEYLEHIALVLEAAGDDAKDKISLMTLHAAKGTEFETVFLPGWEEDIFPNPRTLDEVGDEGLEEERRLAHVGLTRAKKRVIISFAGTRQIHGQWQNNRPSRFIDEIPEQYVVAESADPNAIFDSKQTQLGISGGRDGRGSRNESKNKNMRKRRKFAKTDKIIDMPTKKSAPAGGHFECGVRIFHQKFGYGRVEAVEGNKLQVAFEKAGNKKVLDSFVEHA